jgi:hypothetical protein
VLGYDNEICKFQWTWDNVTGFDPDKFEFMVHKWDRIMGEQDYYIWTKSATAASSPTATTGARPRASPSCRPGLSTWTRSARCTPEEGTPWRPITVA